MKSPNSRLSSVVGALGNLQGANIDLGPGQSDAALRKRSIMERVHRGLDAQGGEDIVTWRIRVTALIEELVQSAQPHRLPDDFLEFQMAYGGLSIGRGEELLLNVYGFGWDTMNSHGALQDPELLGVVDLARIPYLPIGFLFMADLDQQNRRRYAFLFALEGSVDGGRVFAVRDRRQGHAIELLEEAGGLPSQAKPLAETFTDWLELAVESNGTFFLE
jgi:hypothetical protein